MRICNGVIIAPKNSNPLFTLKYPNVLKSAPNNKRTRDSKRIKRLKLTINKIVEFAFFSRNFL